MILKDIFLIIVTLLTSYCMSECEIVGQSLLTVQDTIPKVCEYSIGDLTLYKHDLQIE